MNRVVASRLGREEGGGMVALSRIEPSMGGGMGGWGVVDLAIYEGG